MRYTILTMAAAATFASAQTTSSSSSMVTSGASTPTNQGPMPAPSPTVVAPAGSLPLGAECNPFVTPSQCANGVQCWASNAMLIAQCGNFNAECDSDAQCAYNICSGGLCRGFKPSSEFPVQPSTAMNPIPAASTVYASSMTPVPSGSMAPMPSGAVPPMPPSSMVAMPSGTMEHMPSGIVPPHMINGTMTIVPTGTGAMPTGPANATATGAPQFTGAAAVDSVAGGVMAIVFGAVAWAL